MDTNNDPAFTDPAALAIIRKRLVRALVLQGFIAAGLLLVGWWLANQPAFQK